MIRQFKLYRPRLAQLLTQGTQGTICNQYASSGVSLTHRIDKSLCCTSRGFGEGFVGGGIAG